MSGTGKVLSNENRQRKILEPEVKIEILKNDNHFSTIYGSPGDDSRPLIADSVAYIEGNNTGSKTAVGFLDTKNPPVSGDGERRLYSRDLNGAIQALIFLKDNGIAEINGNTDFPISFTVLQTLLNTLTTNINAEFVKIQNSLDSIPAPIPYVPTAVSIDLTTAKITKVTLPSP